MLPIAGSEGSFAAACGNAGVELMQQMLSDSAEPLTLLAIGPLTDVACLLLTAPPQATANIREIIALVSRLEGESLTVNGTVVNDFNFRMDPLGGALFLDSARQVPIRLISFALSGQTSQQGPQLIAFDAQTLKGPDPPTQASEASLSWLLAALEARNQFWSGFFGSNEGPFDQYTLAAAIHPELFECKEGLAYVQQCPYPAWSPDYDPSEEPYNHGSDNPCVDHGKANGSTLSTVPAQLIVTLDTNDSGPLVRGATGVDGNLPQLGPARPVTVCVDFAGTQAFDQFRDLLYENTWD